MKNKAALRAFAEALRELESKTVELLAMIEDELGVAEEKVNFGHVGSAQFMLDIVERAMKAGQFHDR